MGLLTALFNTLIILVSLFLICLILIQRGKGGGLAGAFGGVGGSSAFGTKAGDTFTRITVVTASIWILMAMLLVVLTSQRSSSGWGTETPSSLSKDLTSSKGKTTSAGTGGETVAPSTSTSSTPPAEVPAPSGAAPALPNTATFPDAPGTSTPKKP